MTDSEKAILNDSAKDLALLYISKTVDFSDKELTVASVAEKYCDTLNEFIQEFKGFETSGYFNYHNLRM